MFRLSRMRHGPEEMDVFRPWTRYTYQSGSVYKQNFLIRQLMAVVKNKKEASKSALFNQKRLAKERSNLYSNRSIKDRPIWLNEVRGQDISGQQPIRLEPYSYGKSQRTDQLDIYSGGKFASGRTIRKRLAANSINGYFSKPHVDGWFSDEKTLKYGKLWQEYEEDCFSLRCYLKEEILEQERIQKAEEAAKIDELPARLAFNDQWNWKNTFTRRQALKDIKYQTKEQEYFTRVRMNKENLDTQRQAYDKVKGYLQNQIRMDENFGSHLEDRIDSAVDNPTAYNFSVDENSKIYDRKVPFYSNVDKKYEASQEEMARKLSNLDVEATEGDKSEDQPRKIRTKLTDFDPEK